jgi:NTP pyrophosphatase (non-canonical NTP hydrolase)
VPDLAVHLLGLVGEVGSIATEYKKMLRDGPAHVALKSRVREELGDVLWYAATVASKFGLDLEDVAVANLQKTADQKTADRWLHLSDGADFFDSAFPPHEQLPRHATFEIVVVEHKGRLASQIFWNGEAAFAMLGGAAPIPASSGQTVRVRLNRSGDPQLNQALHVIVLTRLRYDSSTRAMPSGDELRARPPARSDAASSATSPASSTGSWRPTPTLTYIGASARMTVRLPHGSVMMPGWSWWLRV